MDVSVNSLQCIQVLRTVNIRTAGPRLWAKPQPQRHRRQKRVGMVERLLTFGPAAAGPSDTAALRPGPFRNRAGIQISHSEKFDISLAQKGLAWVSQLTLYNAPRSYGHSRAPARSASEPRRHPNFSQ